MPLWFSVTSIEELERDRWPDPGPDATELMRRCSELRRTPLDRFTVEDLRIMLLQRIGAPILLPRAVDILLVEPLAEGDYYPGDLLRAVASVPIEFWNGLEAEHGRLVDRVALLLASNDVDGDILAAVDAFTRSVPPRR